MSKKVARRPKARRRSSRTIFHTAGGQLVHDFRPGQCIVGDNWLRLAIGSLYIRGSSLKQTVDMSGHFQPEDKVPQERCVLVSEGDLIIWARRRNKPRESRSPIVQRGPTLTKQLTVIIDTYAVPDGDFALHAAYWGDQAPPELSNRPGLKQDALTLSQQRGLTLEAAQAELNRWASEFWGIPGQSRGTHAYAAGTCDVHCTACDDTLVFADQVLAAMSEKGIICYHCRE